MAQRQEVLNVVLAELLKDRGVVAAPENILELSETRHMPDVLVIYEGLRTAIEGEIEGPQAQAKALEAARRRVESGIAHIGIAVVYPEHLRNAEFSSLKAAMAVAHYKVAIVSHTEKINYTAGDIDYLVRSLNTSFNEWLNDDEVARCVELIDTCVERYAQAVAVYPAYRDRLMIAMGVAETFEETDELPPEKVGATVRIAGLILMNAVLFHGMLSKQNRKIPRLDTFINRNNPEIGPDYMYPNLARAWSYILQHVNYYAIFAIAATVLSESPMIRFSGDAAVHRMLIAAEHITAMGAALRHDLMGRVYHRLLSEAKYLGTYYTSIPAASILLKLALHKQKVDWTNPQQIAQLRIADLACGTGTLLSATAEAITDHYIQANAAHPRRLKKLPALHKAVAEEVLYGYDVLSSAIHLTASTLSMRIPDVPLKKMNLFSLPIGGLFHRLGSIEFLQGQAVQMPFDSFGALKYGHQVTGQGDETVIAAPLPTLDLCVMNPPFVRSVGGNLLFGSMPERPDMQERLQRLIRETGAKANLTAGLGSVFVAIGDRYLKEGGQLALILPKALLSGVSWAKTRELINQKYHLDYVIVSHDAERWNFSESTELSEVMLIATRNQNGKAPQGHQTTIINLWHNPTTSLQALSLNADLDQLHPPDFITGQGAHHLKMNGQKAGEVIQVAWEELQKDWFLPCAFAHVDLARVAYHLLKGKLWLPGYGQKNGFKLCQLCDLGTLGPDARDIADGFQKVDYATPFPAFWGHDSQAVLRLTQTPNSFLQPLSHAKPTRRLKSVESLWKLAGSILIAERLRVNSQRLFSVKVAEDVLSSTWWSFRFKPEFNDPRYEKALVLWLNSVFSIIIALTERAETHGAWVKFKKTTLLTMPVLDLRSLSETQLDQFAAAYDRLMQEDLKPFPQIDRDPVRAAIDHAIAQALDLPDFSILRKMLAREPVVSMKRL
ncbi:MAG: hypothetical protein MUF87_05725 [Anaerolineae bacterium]|nr:hypothetical protein [Anaerolineae bacterium]